MNYRRKVMSRPYLLVALITALVFAFSACGSATDPDVKAEQGEAAATQETEAPAGVAIFPDEKVEDSMRLQIRKPQGPITISELEVVTDFSVSDRLQVVDLSGHQGLRVRK